eukprot:scaffold38632_cov168-Amphora_coffeaeformis.AAC.1
MYRDIITPADVMALVDYDLGKSGNTSPDCPVSKRARKDRDKKDCNRPVTSDLSIRARSIITRDRATEKSAEEIFDHEFENLQALLSVSTRGEELMPWTCRNDGTIYSATICYQNNLQSASAPS